MWTYEHREPTAAPSEAIWRVWTDVPGWPEWNPGIASVAIDAPFGVGARIVMTDARGETIEVRVAEVDDGKLFIDEAVFGSLTIRTCHRIDIGEIVYRMEISGDGADQAGPDIGLQITADFPDAAAALARAAERDGAAEPAR